MAEPANQAEAVRESARDLRRGMSPKEIDRRLNEVADDRPLVRHLLNMRVVALAVAIAALPTVIVALFSPPLAGLVLIVSFFAAWFLLARRRYEKRRPTRDTSESDDEEG